MEKNEVQKKGFFDKAMDFIEKIGNAMPDPVSLFIILAIVVVILSAILGSMGSVSYTHLDVYKRQVQYLSIRL